MNHTTKTGECMYFMRGDIHDTRDDRCAWGLKDCEGCPIPQMDIPRGYEIADVDYTNAVCLTCPESPRECEACREDERMHDALKQRAYIITLEQYTR